MKIQIKHRLNINMLFECEALNLKEALILAVKQKTNLQDANLQGANLQGANLQGANLQDANLQDANLQGANLQGANLQGAYLQDAYLQDANLQGAYLQDANLQGAYLQGAYLQDANLQGAYLQGAYLQGAINLISFTATKHFAFAWQFNKTIQISIGCICMPVSDWIKKYKTIGKKEKYTKQEIDTYGAFIKLSKTALQTKTKNKGK